MRVQVRALAKINLHLAVHGRRPDGYHDLTTVFQTIALEDVLTVESWGGPFVLECGADSVPADPSNLVWRAAQLLASETGRGELSGLRVTLQKAIPTRAGLGGGSADAMATLRALQVLWELSLDPAELERLGAGLGADVPFFAGGGTALGSGRGDQLTPLPDWPGHHLAIVRPPFGVSTAAAYAWLAEDRASAAPTRGAGGDWPERSDQWPARIPAMGNDFERIVAHRHPEIRAAIGQLETSGARLALMCGSGSAVAGLFGTEAEARAAGARFEGREGWGVWVSQTVNRADYRAAVEPVVDPAG